MSAATDSYITHRKQLYILPTRIGWIFGLLLLALLVAAIRFNHQATYLLTFVLVAIWVVTSLYTHKNLLSLRLSAKSLGNVFCKEPALFSVTADNPAALARHAIWLNSGDTSTALPFSIANNHQATANISFETQQRGRLTIPPLILTSQYPIGILFSWSKAYQPSINCIVYPEPKNLLPFPEPVEAQSNGKQQAKLSKRGSEELSHTRPYHEGDQPRDIHWQAYAKHQQLVSRELSSDSYPSTELNWQQVSHLSTEDKLSQLTAWVLSANEQKVDYILNIPGFISQNSQGEQHTKQCLKKLALFGLSNDKDAQGNGVNS